MDILHHFEEEGTGHPFILLHGNGEDGSYFINQLRYFSPKYRVILLDTRGHGQTPRGGAPFTIEQFAEDLKYFMDSQNIASAHILGFSDGGNIALTFALKYPEKVNALILNGANLCPSGVKRKYQLPIEIGYRLALRSSGSSTDASKKAELLGLMTTQPNISPASLSALNMPVLVIAGSKDMIKNTHTELIHRSIPNSEMVILEGNHFIAAKTPIAFNTAVESFLDRHFPTFA